LAGNRENSRVAGQVFRYKYRVAYTDCTVGNHVYYARYLDILELARGEFFRDLDEPFLKWQHADTLFPVIECRLRYKSAARYDDLLTVEIGIAELERVRLSFAYRITKEGDTDVVLGSSIHACTSVNEKLKRIPDVLAAKLAPYVQSPTQ
jgi:acyl-CoA thioester hydrolase